MNSPRGNVPKQRQTQVVRLPDGHKQYIEMDLPDRQTQLIDMPNGDQQVVEIEVIQQNLTQQPQVVEVVTPSVSQPGVMRKKQEKLEPGQMLVEVIK